MADLSITAANVIASANAQTDSGIAGATITAGQSLYIDTSDSSKVKPAQATATKYAFAGIALHGAATGQPIKYVKQDAEMTIGATVAVGVVYGLSDTAGGICPVADNGTGDYATVIGIGISTTKITVLASSLLQAKAAKA